MKKHLIIGTIILLIASNVFVYHIGRLVGFFSGALTTASRNGDATYEPIPQSIGNHPVQAQEDNTDEVVTPDEAENQSTTREPNQSTDYSKLVDFYINYYKLDPKLSDWIKRTIDCESSWNPNAIGSQGEIGLCQFQKKTFDSWKNYYGMIDADVYNSKDQIKLMVLMFGDGKWGHWTCSNLTK